MRFLRRRVAHFDVYIKVSNRDDADEHESLYRFFRKLFKADRRFYRRLAQCETGGNVNHSTKSYTGMFGIARGTWQRWSNRSSAAGLTALEQALVVDNIAFKVFFTLH